jgi:hypothetical protein
MRQVSTAAIAATLLWLGPSAFADGLGLGTPAKADGLVGTPVVIAQDLWDGLRSGAFGVLDYGASVVRSVSGWVVGTTPSPDEVKAEDVRGLLSLSDKEFREFDTQVRAAGYVLQGYSFGLDGSSEVELAFDFERALSERERTDLRHLVDQQSGAANTVRHTIIVGLLDASRYIDASPASGYRLAGVTMRLGSPPDVRVRFQRNKP